MARVIRVQIVGDASQLERTFKRLGRSLALFGGGFAGAALLGEGIRAAFSEFENAQKVTAQTAAVLKSTGGVANVTAKQVDTLATSLLNLSGIDDDVIKSGENILLTFTHVRNEVGQGNDIFNQATAAVLDMSVALGEDMQSAAIQVGKALQDPISGVTALRRVGVSFTAAQREQLKALVESGNAMGAQKIILRELTREFGGSAKAAGDTLGGQLSKLKESVLNLSAALVGKAAPGLQSVAEKANKFVADTQKQGTTANNFAQSLQITGKGLGFVAGHTGDVVGRFKLFKIAAADAKAAMAGLAFVNKQFADETTNAITSTVTFTSALDALKAAAAPKPLRDLRKAGGIVIPQGVDVKTHAGASGRFTAIAQRRNQIFDANIARQLDRVQDLALSKQQARLRFIAAEIKARQKISNDETRRLALGDELVDIARRQKQVQDDLAAAAKNRSDAVLEAARKEKAAQDKITAAIKAANKALKDRADQIKSAVIDRLGQRRTDILNKRALQDANEALRIAKQIGGAKGIQAARRGVQDVRLDMLQARLERAPATLTKGGQFALGNVVTINVHGVTDPEEVARRVTTILQKRGAHSTAQVRGVRPVQVH